MNYSIDIINQIAEGSYQYEIDGINAICVNLGGVGGHTYTIDALNEFCTLQGVASGHAYNIDALNAICSGAYTDEYSAWVDVGTKVNQIPEGSITTKNGDMIVLTTGGDYILTVE